MAYCRFVFDGFGAGGYSFAKNCRVKLLPDGLVLTDRRLAL